MTQDDHKDYRSVGEILRDARESASLALEDVAQTTKIAPKAIVAIEADDLDQLAGPIYARSFVRTLAETYRLDPEFLLTKLEQSSASMEVPAVEAPPAFPGSSGPVSGPMAAVTTPAEPKPDETTWHLENVRVRKVEEEPSSRRWLFVGAGAVALLALGFALRGFIGGAEPTDPPVLENDVPLQANQDPGPPPGLSAGSRVRTPDPAPEEAGDDGSTPSPQESEPEQPLQVVSQPAATADPADSPTSGRLRETNPDRDPAPDTAESAPAQPAPSRPADSAANRGDGLPSILGPASSEAAEMNLLVEAVGRVDVWIGADGASRQRHSLTSGSRVQLTGRDHFSLMLSDPRAVRVTLDGVPRTPPPGLRGEWILYPERR